MSDKIIAGVYVLKSYIDGLLDRIAELEAYKEQTEHTGGINISLENKIAELNDTIVNLKSELHNKADP